uniref:Uncharacterized protein n=1 Tax=Aegilops tauschii TaxID=37682 RepID=N1R3P0_AEGTA
MAVLTPHAPPPPPPTKTRRAPTATPPTTPTYSLPKRPRFPTARPRLLQPPLSLPSPNGPAPSAECRGGGGGLEAAVPAAMHGRGGAAHPAGVHVAPGHRLRVAPVRHGPLLRGDPPEALLGLLQELAHREAAPPQEEGAAFAFKSSHEGAIYDVARHIWCPAFKRDGAGGDASDEDDIAIPKTHEPAIAAFESSVPVIAQPPSVPAAPLPPYPLTANGPTEADVRSILSPLLKELINSVAVPGQTGLGLGLGMGFGGLD